MREHKEDIPLLVEHFLKKQPAGRPSVLPPNAMDLLLAHDWPGNVRELRNIVTRLLLFPDLSAEMFDHVERGVPATPSAAAPQAPPEDKSHNFKALLKLSLRERREFAVEQVERRYLAEKLREHRFTIMRMAEDIGVSRQLVYRLLDRYGLRGGGDDAERDSG